MKQTNTALKLATQGDRPRLRIRVRQDERRKQHHVRARRKAAELRECAQ